MFHLNQARLRFIKKANSSRDKEAGSHSFVIPMASADAASLA